MGNFDGVASPVTDDAVNFSVLASPLETTIPESDSFFSRVYKDAQQREENINNVGSYGENLAERSIQKGGQAAAFTTDVAGEGVKSAVNSTPDWIKNDLSQGYQDLKEDPVYKNTLGTLVDYGVKALQSGGGGWDHFREAHPRIARDIEGAANLGLFAGPALKGTEAAIQGTPKVASAVAEGVPKAIEGAKDIAKAAVPKIDEGLRDTASLARKYDIPLSFDQITSSKAVKNAQKVSQELPFSGQAGFKEKQLSAWNKAILKTVGVEGDKFTKANMDKAFSEVGKEFDNLGKGKTFQFDDAFVRRLGAIKEEAKDIANKDAIENFDSVAAKVLKEADPEGSIAGEKLGTLRAHINALARKTKNPDTRDVLHDLENALIDVMTEGDDVAAGSFSATKQKYKNLLAIEPLAVKAKGGNISPSLLNNRVYRIYGRSHVRGNAGEIGDLSQIGYELLPELGGSDTVQKYIYATGATGAAIKSVPITGTVLGANRAVQSGLNRNQKIIDSALKSKK